MYRAIKQNDGTYSISYSEYGLNWEIVLIGVRGCNVNRVVNRMYFEDYYEKS